MRRPFSALLALLAAFALASCGSSQDARTLVRQTFGNAQKVHSGKVQVGINLKAEGVNGLDKPVQISFGGPFERPANAAPRYAFTLTASAQGQTFNAGATSTGQQGFVSVQNTNYVLPAAQYKRLNDSYKQVSGLTQPKTSGNGDIPWLKDPKVEGDETVAGAETTHVSGGVDVQKLLSGVEAKQPQGQQLSAQQQKTIADAIKSPTFDFWTGKDDHVLRRVKVHFRLDVPQASRAQVQNLKSLDVNIDNSLADLNQPQTITAPGSARPVSELASRIQSLIATLQGAAGGAGSGGTGTTTPPSTGGGASSGKVNKYSQCLQQAGGDVAKLQKCAALLR